MRTLLTSIVVLPLVLSLPAYAQGTHSADQLLNSLRPTGNLIQGGTRGLRATPTRPTATQTTASTDNQKTQPPVSGSHQGND